MRWSGNGEWLIIYVINIDATELYVTARKLRRERFTPPYDVDNDVQYDGRQKGPIHLTAYDKQTSLRYLLARDAIG